jgi:site-specific recombinase XerD
MWHFGEEAIMTNLSDVGVTGPLAPFAAAFAASLADVGYSPLSAANQLRLLAHVSRWVEDQGLVPGDLTTECVEAFLHERRDRGYTCWRTAAGMRPMLGFLRDQGIVPPAPPPPETTPTDKLLCDYRRYLACERGLAVNTMRYYAQTARLFLDDRLSPEGLGLDRLSAADVMAFVSRECPARSVGSAKILVTALRSLLRYLHLCGLTANGLAAVVPAVAGWRGSSLPKGIEPSQARALVDSPDRRTAMGCRDHAVLCLVARLGLRACEIAALELSDMDWRHGELAVRGKGNRHERLPLPADVGEAVAGYLQRSRPRVEHPKVFLCVRAPLRGLGVGTVGRIVGRASARSGMAPVSPHQLRHTLATELLGRGASLGEVGQLLRHRSVSTTVIYAKVDRLALASLAQPWPEATR